MRGTTHPRTKGTTQDNVRAWKLIVTLILTTACICPPAFACTLWATTGSQVEGGGSLIAKNRDWKPDHQQSIRVIRPRAGYAYIGLFAEGNRTPGLKAGTNQKGLTVLSASSNIPRQLRQVQPGKHAVMRHILAHYANIDELLRDKEQIFNSARAGFFLISDATKILSVEVALQGRFSTHVVEKGSVAHTNHYLDPSLAGQFNDHPGVSSSIRLTRINTLLETMSRPFNLGTFATMSKDHQDGPDNSLWRHGRKYTLASWIVQTPQAGLSHLHLVLANPGEPEVTQDFLLNDQFWLHNNTRTPLLMPQSGSLISTNH